MHREILKLENKYEKSVQLVEETRILIGKNSDQHKLIEQIIEVRNHVQREREKVKGIEKYHKDTEAEAKKTFDKVVKF